MATVLPATQSTAVFYPSSDSERIAESHTHLDALWATLEVLKQYLEGRQATVLANQFLYFAPGLPRLRVAPDVMVIFNVAPGGRDNYKIWEEGQVPAVIFEVTSPGTKEQDQGFKKTLYEQLEVQEYWLIDPRGEWIEEQLRGFRLHRGQYEPITDGRSEPLQLRLQVEDQLIAFYREDNGEKLLIPGELKQALQAEQQARQQAEAQAQQERQRAEQAELQVRQLQQRLRSLGIDPET